MEGAQRIYQLTIKAVVVVQNWKTQLEAIGLDFRIQIEAIPGWTSQTEVREAM